MRLLFKLLKTFTLCFVFVSRPVEACREELIHIFMQTDQCLKVADLFTCTQTQTQVAPTSVLP